MRILACVSAVVCCAAVSLAQETTGRMMVRTVDGNEQSLVGVSVSIESPALIGGEQTQRTDELGEISFLRLAPGLYRVQAGLDGFATQERREVRVRLGGATALTLVMPEARFADEIVVTDETPVADPSQVGTEQVFGSDYLQRTAIGTWARYYQFVWEWQTPGAVDAGVFGSTSSENAWFIDGVDTSDKETGRWGTVISFDAVQEIEVKTGGYEAEFGRALGGVVSVVTKSGGNQFSGSLDARYTADAFQEDGEFFDGDQQDRSRLAANATLGGPIVRDRLWFFAALSRDEIEDTPFGAPTTAKTTATAPMAKLTWQASPSWRSELSYFAYSLDLQDFNSSQFVAAEAGGSQAGDQDAFSVGLDGVLSDSLLWTLRAGSDRLDFTAGPTSGDLESVAHYNSSTGTWTGNFPQQANSLEDRHQIATDVSWFVGGSAGSHEVKAGLQYTVTGSSGASCNTGTPGGAGCVPGVSGLTFRDVDDELGYDFPYLMWELDPAGIQDVSGTLWSGYAQDAWRPIPNLTVKLGLRYDRASYDNDFGTRVADMGVWQPRVGVAWDITGTATNLLRGSIGRFMDPNTLRLPRWAGTKSFTQYRWTSCSLAAMEFQVDPAMCQGIAGANGWWWREDPEGWDPYGWILDPDENISGGQGGGRVAPDLRAAYSDQFILGYERQLWSQTSVELSYVNKKSRQLFEDTCQGNIPEPSEGADCSFYVMANLPQLRRDYEALIVRFESRGLDWLTLLASYTYSETRGNQENNNTGDFDHYPWEFDNRLGYMESHRRHYLRIHGYALLPYNFTVGFNANITSAFRWTPVANSSDIQEMPPGALYFVEPRGNRKGYDFSNLDLQLSKGFRLGSTHLELILSVLNVFSSENPTEVCTAIRDCGEYALGDPISWQAPRTWEIGMRWEF